MDVFFCPLKIASGSSADLLQELLSNLHTGDCTDMGNLCSERIPSSMWARAFQSLLCFVRNSFVNPSEVCVFHDLVMTNAWLPGVLQDLPARRPVVVCHLQTEPGIVKLSSVV